LAIGCVGVFRNAKYCLLNICVLNGRKQTRNSFHSQPVVNLLCMPSLTVDTAWDFDVGVGHEQ
jgi:hypothetical protein